jgi:hypothetical protein
LSGTGRSKNAGKCDVSASSLRGFAGCGGRCGMRAVEAEERCVWR